MPRKGCCFRVWEVERNAVSMEHPMSNVANAIPNNPPNIQVSLMIAVPFRSAPSHVPAMVLWWGRLHCSSLGFRD